MAALVIVPASDALFPSASRCCPCSGGFRHLPVRRRNQFPCRSWSPAANSLSRLLDHTEKEIDFENLWTPTLLLHLKERKSGEKESYDATEAMVKQPSNKTEAKVSQTEEKIPDKFRVSVELGDAFEPSEISVTLVGKRLNIEGKHEETGDDGHFSRRQFSRSYYLPEDVDIEKLTSALSKEGVLSVEAPRLQLQENESEERNIPIQQTTPPEAVEEMKSEEVEVSGEEEKENLEAGKSQEAEKQEDTSNQSQAAEPTREDSEL